MGALIRKIQPQAKCVRIQPPSSGPSGMAISAPTVVTVTARRRSACSGNSSGMMARPIGMITAAPAPMIARSAISSPAVLTWLAATEARPNRASPAVSILRRPSLSPSFPMGSSSPAQASV